MKLTRRNNNLPAVKTSRNNSAIFMGALAAAYFVAARVGLGLAYFPPNATPVWPASGLALAALLLRGNAVWPGIFIGAFSANFMTAGSVTTSIAIAMGNTAEALAGAWLVRRLANGAEAMERTQDVLKFAVLAGFLSTTISPTIGVTSLALEGFAEWNKYGWTWVTWWMGDATGVVLVAPLLLLWRSNTRFNWRRWAEVATLMVLMVTVGELVFDGLLGAGKRYPLEFLCIPVLVWAAARFGRRGALTATVALTVTAIWGTANGRGPFATGLPNESLVLLQSFLAVCAVMTLALAAEVRQRRHAEREAHSLAISDALTGLGNYRRLVDALELEIKRAERSDRPFAFVLMDLDDLKKINDIHGHLTGTRALCRCADILRLHGRSIDTLARYGGDEFAVILPETGMEEGRRAATRLAQLIADDGEEPRISISFGVAVWPRDGRTTEGLFHAADSALYEMKRGRGGVQVPV